MTVFFANLSPYSQIPNPKKFKRKMSLPLFIHFLSTILIIITSSLTCTPQPQPRVKTRYITRHCYTLLFVCVIPHSFFTSLFTYYHPFGIKPSCSKKSESVLLDLCIFSSVVRNRCMFIIKSEKLLFGFVV